MVFLSIIVPFNKSERYLVDCLDSLKEQNLEDYEILLIVNGYSDSIDDLLGSYKDLNIKLIQFDEEIGVAKSQK